MIIDTPDDTTKVLLSLKKAGITGIIRYYSKSTWKRLTATEARAIAGAGFEMGIVYEDAGATPSSFSAASGTEHAHNAMQQAALCGQPEGSAIYFAVDFDPTDQQINSRILPYFASVYDVIAGKYRIGAYASGRCCSVLLGPYPTLLPWITCSLGFNGTRVFLKAGKQALYQGTFDSNGNPKSGCDKMLYGLSLDYNTAHVDDWGQFVPFQGQGQPSTPVPPVHDVVWMQEQLGVSADGRVGPLTIDAMIKFIEDH